MTDDASGYLPPHELRGLLGQPSVATPTSPHGPGLTAAAATPAPFIPTPSIDDPAALALGIARIAGEQFGGASVVPAMAPPTAPTNMASPGFTPANTGSMGIEPMLSPAIASPTNTATSGLAPTAPTNLGSPGLPDLDMLARMLVHATPGFSPEIVGSVPLVDAPAAAPPVGGSNIQAPPSIELPVVEYVPLLDLDHDGGTFDPHVVRRDFPILEERVHGKRLVWLDNAATTQKPRSVIDRISYFYEHENSNVHRGAHTLAARATDAFESARETTRKFLNASSSSEIVFVRGATEGINLIAKAWGARYVERGDEIVVTHLEHHANIVPWQQLCAATGARLRVAPVDDRGDVILEEYEKLMCSRTKLVAFTHVSNALGTITPAREMIEIAHRWGATVVLDGAQSVSHMPVDVQELDCDFFVFSGHKVFAPTGIGAVYGKRAVLEATPPWQGGGNMIQDVTFERTVYHQPPWRFEAGTGNIADAAGMGAALDYVMRLGMPTIDRYEHELLEYALERLPTVRGLEMIGNPRRRASVLSFVLEGKRTEDVGGMLDKYGIAVRSGHHCAQPILRRFGVEASVRASLAFYNVREDIDELIAALHEIQASV